VFKPGDEHVDQRNMATASQRLAIYARRVLIGCALMAFVVLAIAVATAPRSKGEGSAAPVAVAGAHAAGPRPASSHPQVVEPEAGVAAPDQTPAPSSHSRAVDDAEIRRELRQLKALAAHDDLIVGSRARVFADGRAAAPQTAPGVVREVIRGANVIATTPYLWGGGHGSWSAVGYDCSGSVSFALAGAGLLSAPLTSGELARWGAPGPGRWITIYANAGHAFMEVAGLRFDTGGLRGTSTRWQTAGRDTSGFVARHPVGL
jgi:cell wall-associated NlpC family hydrolase